MAATSSGSPNRPIAALCSSTPPSSVGSRVSWLTQCAPAVMSDLMRPAERRGWW